ncbi:MAG: ABC transporter permease [Chloroflexota bacterium]|nr:FtsX-like permease family protein [Candidatus Sulfotelmatobacter sp.]
MSRRFGNLVNYSLSCIKRYRIRTFVILISLVTATALISSMLFIKDGISRDGQISLKYAPDITVQAIQNGRQTFINTSYIPLIQPTLGVKTVIDRIWGYGNIGNTLVVIVGIDTETPIINLDSAYPIESGTFLEADQDSTVVMGKAVADLLGAKVGNVLSLISESNQVHKFKIVGVFNTESGIYNSDTILMTKTDARLFFDVPEGKATDLLIYTEEIDPQFYRTQVNFIARETSELPNVRVLTKDIIASAQEVTYGSKSGYFSILWILVLIAVAIVAFNQTVVVGHESKFEIGLLKALGFSTSDIIQIRLIEGTVLGFLAGSIGLIVGILFDSVLNAPVLKDFILGWATLYPAFPVPLLISAETVFLTYVISIVPLLFAIVIPSWLNATVDPDISMRGARA